MPCRLAPTHAIVAPMAGRTWHCLQHLLADQRVLAAERRKAEAKRQAERIAVIEAKLAALAK